MDEKQFNELVEKVGKEAAEKIKAQFAEHAIGAATKEDIDGLKNDLKEFGIKSVGDIKIQGKSLEDILREQGEAIEAAKKNRNVTHDDLSTRGQIKAYIEKNQAEFEAFKRRETMSFGMVKAEKGESMAGINIKAAGTMLISTNTNSSAFVPAPEIVPGLVDLVRNRPFLEDYSNTTATSNASVVWTEKTNPDGEANFIGEGVVKPLIDFEIISRRSYAKKVADKIKVSTEMLDDIDFMAAEIESELKYQVDIHVDEELLNGVGDGGASATDLKGLTQYAGGYVLTSISTETPNKYDAIRASIAQIVSLNFNPTHVFINPIDGANMDLTKDSQGRPLAMEYKDSVGRIFRLNIVETNQMPVGSFLMGDMSKFKVRNYKPFAIYMGWVNDDFEKNLVTIIGERRLHCYVYTNHTGAFIYDQFADVQTAITAGIE